MRARREVPARVGAAANDAAEAAIRLIHRSAAMEVWSTRLSSDSTGGVRLGGSDEVTRRSEADGELWRRLLLSRREK